MLWLWSRPRKQLTPQTEGAAMLVPRCAAKFEHFLLSHSPSQACLAHHEPRSRMVFFPDRARWRLLTSLSLSLCLIYLYIDIISICISREKKKQREFMTSLNNTTGCRYKAIRVLRDSVYFSRMFRYLGLTLAVESKLNRR